MRLNRLLTTAVLAVALAGCALSDLQKQVRNTNPVAQSTNPLGTTPAYGAGWGNPAWGDYRSSQSGCVLSC